MSVLLRIIESLYPEVTKITQLQSEAGAAGRGPGEADVQMIDGLGIKESMSRLQGLTGLSQVSTEALTGIQNHVSDCIPDTNSR